MHSTFVYQTILPFKATASVERGLTVKADGLVDGVAACSIATAGTDPIIGVAVAGGGAGDTVDVQVSGACFDAVLGAAAAPGSFLTAGADGKLVAAQSGERAVGMLLGPRDHADALEADSLVVVMVGLTSVP